MPHPPTVRPARIGAIVCAACGRRGGVSLQEGKPLPAVPLCPRCRPPRPLTPARSDPTALLALRAA